MSYKLKFVPKALKEWGKLDNSIKNQFKKIIERRLENPHITAAKLSHLEHCYKIKIKGVAYRLVYRVEEQENAIIVLVVAKREDVYKLLEKRIKSN